MKKILSALIFGLLALNLTGCGLATMKEVPLVDSVGEDQALVNIVRPRVFAGDGTNVDMWDGDKFIGTLEAGSMIQYQADPGEHTFMVCSQGSWGVAKGMLLSGKQYFLKYNIGFGFVSLGVALPNDARISEWPNELTPVAIDSEATKPIPSEEVEKARKIYEKIERGDGKYTAITDRNAI